MVPSSLSSDRHLNTKRSAWPDCECTQTKLQKIGNKAIEYPGCYFNVVKVSSLGQLKINGAFAEHRFNTNTVFAGIWMPITKIGGSWDRLVLIMEIPIPAIKRFYSETTPRCWCSTFHARGSQSALNFWTCRIHPRNARPWFNIKMLSDHYRKSHCGDKTVVRSSYLDNGVSYTGKMTSLWNHQQCCWFLYVETCNFGETNPQYRAQENACQVRHVLMT